MQYLHKGVLFLNVGLNASGFRDASQCHDHRRRRKNDTPHVQLLFREQLTRMPSFASSSSAGTPSTTAVAVAATGGSAKTKKNEKTQSTCGKL
jgi:hypothetical protein